MTAAFAQVQALLTRLTPDERNKIKLLIAKHPGTAAKRSVASFNEVEADWLLQGILAELRRRGHKPHIKDMSQIRGLCVDYEMTSQEVREHLEAMLPSEVTAAELRTLGTITARALIDRFRNVPIGLKPLLQLAGRSMEALDDSFPGYLGSGMIYWIVKRKA